MSNSYFSPHLRRIWGTSIIFVLPAALYSLTSERPEKSAVFLLLVLLCSWTVLKAIFSSKTQTCIFLGCLALSFALVFSYFFSGSYLPFIIIPIIPLLWGQFPMMLFSKFLKITSAIMVVNRLFIAANKALASLAGTLTGAASLRS